MFDYVLHTRLSLVVNEIWINKEPISLIGLTEWYRYGKAGAMGKACNFIKKETLAQVFYYEFCEISKNTFSTEHLQTTASELTVK